MGKRFEVAVDSEVGVDDVFAVLSAESWPAHMAAQLGDGSRLVSREVHPDGAVTLVLSRALPAGIPGFLQKFLPADPRVVTTDAWGPLLDGVRECQWTADITGAPASVTGTQRIAPLGAGNRHTTAGQVTVSVPLIGGRAEGFIAEQVRRLVEAETAVVAKVLSAGPPLR